MTTDRFDRLTTTLSAAGTRRGLLRRAAALPLASLLAALLGAAREVGAERPVDRLLRRTPQRRRRRGTNNRTNNGTNNGTNNRNNNRNNGGSGAHCGSGPACPSGQVCLSGACFTTCPAPTTCFPGGGGCPGNSICFQTRDRDSAGVSVCASAFSNNPCTTADECARIPQLGFIGPICVLNPSTLECPDDPNSYCVGAGLR
jgi:hypothetical protein